MNKIVKLNIEKQIILQFTWGIQLLKQTLCFDKQNSVADPRDRTTHTPTSDYFPTGTEKVNILVGNRMKPPC